MTNMNSQLQDFSCSFNLRNDNAEGLKNFNIDAFGTPSAAIQEGDTTNNAHKSVNYIEGGGLTSDVTFSCMNYMGESNGRHDSINLGIGLKHITPPVGDIEVSGNNGIHSGRIPYNQLSSIPSKGEVAANIHMLSAETKGDIQNYVVNGVNMNFSANKLADKTQAKAHGLADYEDGAGYVGLSYSNPAKPIRDAASLTITGESLDLVGAPSIRRDDNNIYGGDFTGSLDFMKGLAYSPNTFLRYHADAGGTLGVDDLNLQIGAGLTVSNDAQKVPKLIQTEPEGTVKRFAMSAAGDSIVYATLGARSYYIKKSRFDVPLVATYEDGRTERFEGEINSRINEVYAEVGVRDMRLGSSDKCMGIALHASSTDKGITDGAAEGHSLASLDLRVGDCPKISFQDVEENDAPLPAIASQVIRDGVPIK